MLITPLVAGLVPRVFRLDIFFVMSEGDTSYKPGRAHRKQSHRRHNRS
jgi:hypothetical protein